MKCPKCKCEMKEVKVSVEGASKKALSNQCSCGYFEFEPRSSAAVLKELKAKESPLTIEQKVIRLSKGRLGVYFNKNLIRCLNIRPGETIYFSVPDKKHIILTF